MVTTFHLPSLKEGWQLKSPDFFPASIFGKEPEKELKEKNHLMVLLASICQFPVTTWESNGGTIATLTVLTGRWARVTLSKRVLYL